jgi:hypothetical protein
VASGAFESFDVFSGGYILWELLTGKLLLDGVRESVKDDYTYLVKLAKRGAPHVCDGDSPPLLSLSFPLPDRLESPSENVMCEGDASVVLSFVCRCWGRVVSADVLLEELDCLLEERGGRAVANAVVLREKEAEKEAAE